MASREEDVEEEADFDFEERERGVMDFLSMEVLQGSSFELAFEAWRGVHGVNQSLSAD